MASSYSATKKQFSYMVDVDEDTDIDASTPSIASFDKTSESIRKVRSIRELGYYYGTVSSKLVKILNSFSKDLSLDELLANKSQLEILDNNIRLMMVSLISFSSSDKKDQLYDKTTKLREKLLITREKLHEILSKLSYAQLNDDDKAVYNIVYSAIQLSLKANTSSIQTLYSYDANNKAFFCCYRTLNNKFQRTVVASVQNKQVLLALSAFEFPSNLGFCSTKLYAPSDNSLLIRNSVFSLLLSARLYLPVIEQLIPNPHYEVKLVVLNDKLTFRLNSIENNKEAVSFMNYVFMMLLYTYKELKIRPLSYITAKSKNKQVLIEFDFVTLFQDFAKELGATNLQDILPIITPRLVCLFKKLSPQHADVFLERVLRELTA